MSHFDPTLEDELLARLHIKVRQLRVSNLKELRYRIDFSENVALSKRDILRSELGMLRNQELISQDWKEIKEIIRILEEQYENRETFNRVP